MSGAPRAHLPRMPLHPLLLSALLGAPLAPALSTPPAARPEAEALRALALIAAGEPGPEEVARAAANEADAGEGAAGSPRRARIAALLPRVTAEYRRDERRYRVVGLQGSGEVDYLRLAPGSAFGVHASWDLGGLVAPQGEPAAAAAAAARASRREVAARRATALFFERRRAQLALLVEPPASALARAAAELEVDRLTAELDLATGGLLSRGDRR